MTNENDTDPTDQRSSVQRMRDAAQDRRDAAAYRDLMESVDSGRHELNDESLRQMRPGMERKFAESVGKFDAAQLDETTREAMSTARNLIDDAFSTAETSGKQITRYLRDQSVWPGQKRETVDPMVSDAVKEMNGNIDTARIFLDTAEEGLYESTRPVLADGKGMEAREDARMLLDGASDAAEVMRRVGNHVESSDDHVAALFADPGWLRTYMNGRGMDPATIDAQQGTVREKIAVRARTSTDPRRKASALALDHVRNVRAAIDVVNGARTLVDPRPRR